MGESGQIHVSDGFPVVNHSDVQGGWTGTGVFNINADPLFVDADGADNTVGTDDDDLRLPLASPCLNAGDNSAWPFGLDAYDLDGNWRMVCCDIDMGAYEFQGCSPQPTNPADFDCDGDVDGIDFSFFTSAFNKAGNPPRPARLP